VFSTTKAVGALMIAWAADRGLLDYEQTVASLWPAFAQAGEGRNHGGAGAVAPGGAVGFRRGDRAHAVVRPGGDRGRCCSAAPLWEPGTASGYSPTMWGVIAGELFRRAEGRSLGQALREELGEPFGIDVWIGVPPGEDDRVPS
jgi:CubicO group peptidase (beta-lactamase class C family)